ncbi:hypothetical protein EI94DRAFT_1912815, partial [Lactarius quietus]
MDSIRLHTVLLVWIAFRYLVNFGLNWTQWSAWADTTFIDTSGFDSSDYFWQGQHIMVQYWTQLMQSAAAIVHADLGYGQRRRVPQFFTHGPFNAWGFDKGITAQMTQNSQDKWELAIMSTWPTY